MHHCDAVRFAQLRRTLSLESPTTCSVYQVHFVMHAVCARDERRVHATEFIRVIACNKITFIQAGCAQIATVYLRTDICKLILRLIVDGSKIDS